MVRTFALLKSFLHMSFTFHMRLKIDYSNFKAVIFFLIHKYTNFTFSSWKLSVIASDLLQDFLLNQTHVVRFSFWFLETQGSTIDSIYGLLLVGRSSKYSIDTTVSKLSYSKNDIFHSVPQTKLLLCPFPTVTTPIPYIIEKFRPKQ